MRPPRSAWVWPWLGLPLMVSAVDLEEVFHTAWSRDPAAHQARSRVEAATLTRETARWTEFPSLAMTSTQEGGPPLGSYRASDDSRSATVGLGLTLTQRLPWGGRLTFGSRVSRAWVWPTSGEESLAIDPTFDWTLGSSVPLVGAFEGALADRALAVEVLGQQVARAEAYVTLVRAASAVAVARRLVRWRRSQNDLAAAALRLASAEADQGRLTPAELWQATQKAEEALWALVQSETEEGLANSAWERLAHAPLPDLDVATVVTFGRTRGPESPWAVSLAIAQKDLEHLQIQAERSAAGPAVEVGAWASRDPAQRWTWGGQVAFAWGTEGWGVGAVLDRKQVVVDQRWDSVIGETTAEADELRRRRVDEARALEAAIGRAEVQVARWARVVEASEDLFRRQDLGDVERLEALVALRSAETERERLAWRTVELSALLGPPVWVFR